jgi:hypothetical protein
MLRHHTKGVRRHPCTRATRAFRPTPRHHAPVTPPRPVRPLQPDRLLAATGADHRRDETVMKVSPAGRFQPCGLEVTTRARSILRHFLECVPRGFKDRRGYLGQQLHRFVDVVHDPDGPAKLRRIDSGADLLFDPVRHVRPTRIRARGSDRKTSSIGTASRCSSNGPLAAASAVMSAIRAGVWSTFPRA